MNALVGDELVLEVVDNPHPDSVAAFDGVCDPLREGVTRFAVGVFADQGAVFSDDAMDLNIEDLSGFMAD